MAIDGQLRTEFLIIFDAELKFRKKKPLDGEDAEVEKYLAIVQEAQIKRTKTGKGGTRLGPALDTVGYTIGSQ